MATVFDVAKYILKQTGPISSMKLQKLVYYSQAWSLVWEEKPLFSNRIEAWANGPVSPELFDRHRGKFIIEAADFSYANDDSLNENQKDTINKVIEFYNKYDSASLSELTHREDPWKDARKRANVEEGDRCNEEIKLDDMQKYYEAL